MKLYNTLTRTVEELKPLKAPQVTVYTCGPTVYDYAHIGHWFNYVRWDTLIRALKVNNFEPLWVMNITDVGHLVSDADDGEDKLEKGARREGKTAWEVAEFYTKDFLECMQLLNMAKPNHIVKATDHIAEQIELIKKLEEKEYTYVIDDGVYYDTSKFEGYAAFARLDLDDQQEGARVATNPQKRNPSDFALWKFSPKDRKRDMEWWAPWQRPDQKPDEEHPIGLPRSSHLSAEAVFSPSSARNRIDNTMTEQHRRKTASVPKAPEQGELSSSGSGAVRGSWGFPGWHIECSAMSMKYLGETLDIHTGGIDHIPVHHTNEIAQSEAATGKRFANVWLHGNHITIEGQKISKSLGNGIRLQEVNKKGISTEALRLHVLESHYRSQSKFSWASLEAAQNRLTVYQRMADLQFQAVKQKPWLKTFLIKPLFDAMRNDLDTPQALATLSEFATTAENKLIAKGDATLFQALLYQLDQLFALRLSERKDITSEQKILLADRQKARDAKDWQQSDKLRDELTEQGIGVRDTAHGAIWYRV